MPIRLAEELRKGLSGYPADQRFSVRSSSTLEDLADAAFAGMHETSLNCRGLDHLLDKIRTCYVSLWSERAIAYRHHKGFHHEASRMSIVIQSMVDCTVAGVGFAWVDFGCRLVAGTPSCATCFQITLPVFVSSLITLH